MTDAPPPSIPPRNPPAARTAAPRPVRTVPGKSGEPADQASGELRVEQRPAPAAASASSVPAASSLWPASAPPQPPMAAPAPAPARVSATGASPAVSSSGRPAPAASSSGPVVSSSGAATTPARVPSSSVAASAGASTADPDDDEDGPSPLATAVDRTSEWLKHTATSTGATLSAAYASLTRPRPKDPEMTANPVAPAATATTLPPATTNRAGAPAPRPATGRVPAVSAGPRRVRLAVSRVDPWSVMKLAFLLSFAMGIMLVVAVAVVWATLNGLHVFTSIDGLIQQIVGSESDINVLQYAEFSKVMSVTTLVAIVDIFLLTALATIGAFLYNIVAALVGGIHVTMTDE